VDGVRVEHFALYSAPAARVLFDVLHEPVALAHPHDAAPANVTAHEPRQQERVALFKNLGDLVGVGDEVVFFDVGGTLVPEPPRTSHVESLE
jgi:hypothetical protein